MRKLLGLLIIVAACGPKITTTMLNPSPRPLSPKLIAEVEIYTTQLPPRPYIEVAVLSASKGDAEDHIDKLRESAASYGCDALVFTRMPSQSDYAGSYSSSKPGQPGMSGGGTVVGSSSATCVVWQEPATAAAPAEVGWEGGAAN